MVNQCLILNIQRNFGRFIQNLNDKMSNSFYEITSPLRKKNTNFVPYGATSYSE